MQLLRGFSCYRTTERMKNWSLTWPSKYHAHDEGNALKVGDVARIVECAPKSKLKRWEVVSPASAS